MKNKREIKQIIVGPIPLKPKRELQLSLSTWKIVITTRILERLQLLPFERENPRKRMIDLRSRLRRITRIVLVSNLSMDIALTPRLLVSFLINKRFVSQLRKPGRKIEKNKEPEVLPQREISTIRSHLKERFAFAARLLSPNVKIEIVRIRMTRPI